MTDRTASTDEQSMDGLKQGLGFAGLSETQFEVFLKHAQFVKFTFGSTIHPVGSTSEKVYFLVSGKVRLFFRFTGGGGEQEQTVCLLSRPGDFFCVEESEKTPLYGARASSDAVVCCVSRDAVSALSKDAPGWANHLKHFAGLYRKYVLIQQCGILRQFGFWKLQALLTEASEEAVSAGQVPARAGLCILVEGEWQKSAGGAVNRGSLLGADWLSDSGAGEETVVAKTAASLMRFEWAAVASLQSSEPELFLAMHELFDTDRSKQVDSMTPALPLFEISSGEPQRAGRQTDPPGARIRRILHHYPFIRQPNAMDCGAACLGMISWFYGQRLNLNSLRQLCGVTRFGTSMLNIAESAEKLGFITRGLRLSYDGLSKVKLPVICFWRNNHYVVLYEVNHQRAIVGDPAQAILQLDRDAFCKDFSGVVLELTPTNRMFEGVKADSPLSVLWPLCVKHESKIRSVFFASLAGQILLLIQPIFSQVIIDKVIVHQNESMLNVVLIGMLVLALIQAAVGYLRAFLLSYVSMRIDQELIVNFYRHLLSLPFKFFQDRTIADVTNRFAQNRTITSFLTGPGVTVVLDTLTFAVCLCILFFYNLEYALATLGYLLLYSLLIALCTPYLKNLNRVAFERNTKVQGHLIESMRAIENIKAGAAENERRWKWELLFFDAQMVGFQQALASSTIGVIATFIGLCGQLVLLWLGASLVISGKLSIGQLFALQMIVARLSQSVLGLVNVWDQIQNVNISLERLGDVLEAEPEEADPKTKIPMPTVSGHVVFDKVCFRYTDLTDKNTLSVVSFEAKPGEMIGIVGSSGSGKTTLVRLIQGLFLPLSGTITVDGKDLKLISMSDYRKHMGVVSQNEHLCGATVREALCLYHPKAEMEQVIEAATIAGIHDFVRKLPQGYETPLAEGGYNFSGGQRQRLAIARAILKKPSLLIFDEATSALDTESEQHIQRSLEELRSGRTMFVIAHRLSTVTRADRLIVVDQGQIVETGTHNELLEARGLYYYLCKQQLDL